MEKCKYPVCHGNFRRFWPKISIKLSLLEQENLRVHEVTVIFWPLTQDSYSIAISHISSKDADPVVTTFHIESPGKMKVCSNRPGHMINIVTTFI